VIKDVQRAACPLLTVLNHFFTIPDFHQTIPIDKVGVEERVARLNKRSIKKESKLQGLKLALSMIDHTTLEGKDSEGKVIQLCRKARLPYALMPDLPSCSSLCVPEHGSYCKKSTPGITGINVASVATAFPSGMAQRQAKLDDTRYAVEQGADEIDMVISRGEFLKGNYNFVFDEIAA
jgi:deoxyribose-phosphate aldolase